MIICLFFNPPKVAGKNCALVQCGEALSTPKRASANCDQITPERGKTSTTTDHQQPQPRKQPSK